MSIHNAYAPGTPGLPVFPAPILLNRVPAGSDIDYPIGQVAIYQATDTAYILTSKSAGVATWITASLAGSVNTLTGDSGGAISPTAGNIDILGTAAQVDVAGSGSQLQISLIGPYTPATYTDHGVLVGSGASDITALSVGSTGEVLIGATGADPAFGALGVNSGLTDHGLLVGGGNTAIGALAVGATGETLMGSTGADPAWSGSPSFSGSVTAATTITATLGAITATNGNFVKGTAGNKDVYSSVAVAEAAGANSAGSVTLVGGTATIATTAVTANSLIRIYRQGIGSTGAAALGILTIGTITASTSFVINSVQAADATALQASDVSVVFWEIVN